MSSIPPILPPQLHTVVVCYQIQIDWLSCSYPVYGITYTELGVSLRIVDINYIG